MFVRLDDGPRPFDDVLQAQRTGMVQQQQGFENALAAEQYKTRRDQGAQELDILKQRNNLIRKDTAGRTVSRALKTAETFGRPIVPSRQSFETMFAEVAKSNPEAAQELMAKYGDVEFDDDPTDDPVFAQMFEDTSGLWLAEEGKRSVGAAERALVGSQAIMADPRAGLTDKDLEPVMKLLEEGTAPAEQIEAQFQALRSKAAKNIGFAEMKVGVLGEVTQAWGSAMAQINSGASKSMALPGEKSDAELLATLRGEIETATTPEELHRARGQFMVKAYGLDGVISEAETAAFEAGRAAADAMYRQVYGGAMGVQQQAPEGGAAAQAPVQGGGPRISAESHPNLTAAVGRAAGAPPPPRGALGDDEAMSVLMDAGFEGVPEDGTPEAAEASRLIEDVQSRALAVVEEFEGESEQEGSMGLTARAQKAGIPPRVVSEIWQDRQAQRATDDAVKKYARTAIRQLRDFDSAVPDAQVATELVRRKIAPTRDMALKTVAYLRSTGW